MSQVFSHSHMPFKIAVNRLVSNLVCVFFFFFAWFCYASKLPITASMWIHSLRNDEWMWFSLYDNTDKSVLLLLLFLLYKMNGAKGIRKPHCVWKMYAQFHASITPLLGEKRSIQVRKIMQIHYEEREKTDEEEVVCTFLDRALNCIPQSKCTFKLSIRLLVAIFHLRLMCIWWNIEAKTF